MLCACIQFDLTRRTPFNHYRQIDYSDFTPHKDRDLVNFATFVILYGSCSLMIKQIIRSKGWLIFSTKKACLLKFMMVPAFRQDNSFIKPLTFWIVRKATNRRSRLRSISISILLSGSPAAPRRLSSRPSGICLCLMAKERSRWYHYKVQSNITMVARTSGVLGIETILALFALSLMALRYRHRTTVRVFGSVSFHEAIENV